MGSTAAIRPVVEDDLDHLDEVHPEPGRPTSRHRDRFDLQQQGEGIYLVAWLGGEPVGWVLVLRPGASAASPRAQQLDVAEIIDLSVAERFRGQGHGRALLEAAERIAADVGWSPIGLSVTVSNPHNAVARAMYARRGYRDAGLGEFEDGYFYWTPDGEKHWDGEPHRFLIKP